MEQAFRDLIEFERACGHEPSTKLPGEEATLPLANLRDRLINEEAGELIAAIHDFDIPGIADGCADLIYVTIGTAVRYGIDLVPIWRAVQAANMTKANGPRRADGKILKPEGFKHPDIAGILAAQRPLSELYGKEATQ